jgi:hypothetical protein
MHEVKEMEEHVLGYWSMLDLVTELDQKLSLDREARRLGVTRQSLNQAVARRQARSAGRCREEMSRRV